MDPISFTLAFLPVAQVVHKTCKQIRKYKKQIPRAKSGLRAIEQDISDFRTLVCRADQELLLLNHLNVSVQPTPKERGGLKKICKNAKRLFRSFSRFLSEQKDLWKSRRGIFALLTNILATRHWMNAQPDIALFKGRMLSLKGSLSILLTIVSIRMMAQLLEQAMSNPAASEEERECLRQQKQSAEDEIRSKVVEMQTLKEEIKQLEEVPEILNTGADQQAAEQTLQIVDLVNEIVEQEVPSAGHSRPRSQHGARRPPRSQGSRGHQRRHQPPSFRPGYAPITPPSTDSSHGTQRTNTGSGDYGSDSSDSEWPSPGPPTSSNFGTVIAPTTEDECIDSPDNQEVETVRYSIDREEMFGQCPENNSTQASEEWERESISSFQELDPREVRNLYKSVGTRAVVKESFEENEIDSEGSEGASPVELTREQMEELEGWSQQAESVEEHSHANEGSLLAPSVMETYSHAVEELAEDLEERPATETERSDTEMVDAADETELSPTASKTAASLRSRYGHRVRDEHGTITDLHYEDDFDPDEQIESSSEDWG